MICKINISLKCWLVIFTRNKSNGNFLTTINELYKLHKMCNTTINRLNSY